jgi:hypothetical protein
MIVVTGTKRSGTSMWMQILQAAGYRLLGERFPRDWGRTIREANKQGFYESPLRHGIRADTNRHPETGKPLDAASTRGLAVKVFARGLLRTESAYLSKVIATVRPWREVQHSLERLYAMEHANKLALAKRRGWSNEVLPSLAHPPSVLEWWHDNVSLLRDAGRRRYPLRLVSYASVLRSTSSVVRNTLDWLGGGQLEAALACIQPTMRTQDIAALPPVESGLSPAHEAVFDELYARIDTGIALDPAFLNTVDRVHRELVPRLVQAQGWARAERAKARARARALLGDSGSGRR